MRKGGVMMETTGARESNAGDDFHFIWVAKRTLKLFEPNTEFSAITVEGPSEEECMIFEGQEGGRRKLPYAFIEQEIYIPVYQY